MTALALAIGLTLVFGVDVLISMGDLWVTEGTGLDLDTRGANRGLAEIGLLLRFLHPTGGAFMAPVFAWGLVLLGPYRAGVMQALIEVGYGGFVGQEFIPTRDPVKGLMEAVEVCDV